MVKGVLLKLSTFLYYSHRYQKTKAFLRQLLTDNNYRYKRYFDMSMILLIVFSITLLILSKNSKIPQSLIEFDLYIVSAIFALEYLLRFWVYNDVHQEVVENLQQNRLDDALVWQPMKRKIRYLFTPSAIIDLLAIFPQFRIVRLLKLFHYMHGASSLFQALLSKRFEFLFLGYILFGVTFVFGSIFYWLEYGINESIESYLDAIYWALITTSTVGYGDISPVTSEGKVLSMIVIVFGIAMISFVTSVMVSAFSERFDELRNRDSLKYVHKLKRVVVINGYGHLGKTIATKLREGKRYTPIIIEEKPEKVAQAREEGLYVISGDASSAKIIETLYHRDNIVAMLTLTSSDIDNIYFILNAKSIYANAVVFTRMNQTHLRVQYSATKVDAILEPYEVVTDKALQTIEKEMVGYEGITLFGYTQKSQAILKVLEERGYRLSIYETDSSLQEQAKANGVIADIYTINDDEMHYKTLLPSLEKQLIVLATASDALMVYQAISLRANGIKNTMVALSDSKEDNRKLYLAGVTKIFDMYEESANHFIALLEQKESKQKVKK
jgi:voltage-gated potassium channel